jgi:WD40 repeat protein
MSAPSCIDVELMLLARACTRSTPGERLLRQHLEACDACMRVARELENPVVAQALLEAGAPSADLRELSVVPPDVYVRAQEIGRGGMGRIVRARDRRLGRWVAIKELLDEKLRARFEREARLTARLQHPAIVSVHEAGRWPDGEPFYAMKYVAGSPLDKLILERTGLGERLELLPNFITVVEAIAYAHSERVIHRDIKPHNILVGAFGETVVIDWGLAKELSDPDASPVAPYRDPAPQLTAGAAGTPAYMPPEQAAAEGVDERTDVFALGATLFHLLAGRPPPALGTREREGIRASLLSAEPRIPPALAAIVEKAMARAPADRYTTAGAFADELKRFQKGQLVAAYRYSMRERLWAFAKRYRGMVSLGAASAALLAVVGGIALAQAIESRRQAERQLGELLVERGRQELARGAPSRALPFFLEAGKHAVESVDLPILVRTAAEPLTRLESVVELPGLPITHARISPDGTRLVTAGYELDATLWSLPDGKRIAKLRGDPAGSPDDTLFAPDGAFVVTASSCGPIDDRCDHDVRLWDARTGVLRAVLPHARRVLHLRFSEPTTLLTSVFGMVAAWDVPSGRRIGAQASGYGIPFRNTVDGNLFAVNTRRSVADLAADADRYLEIGPDLVTVNVHDLVTGDVRRTIRPREPVVRARLVGSQVLTLSRNGIVRMWDDDGVEIAAWDGHAAEVLDVRLGPDRRLVTVAADNRIRTWRAEPMRTVRIAVVRPQLVRFGPAQQILVGDVSGRVAVHDLAGKELGVLERPTRWTAAAFDATGDRVHLGSPAGRVAAWDLAANRLDSRAVLPSRRRIVHAFSAGRFVDDLGHLLDDAGNVIAAFSGAIAVMRDDAVVTLAREGGVSRAAVWTTSGTLIAVTRIGELVSRATVDLSRDRRLLAVAADAGVRIVALSGKDRVDKMLELDAPVDRLSFGPAGDRLFLVKPGGEIEIVRLDGRGRVTLPARSASLAVSWSPDGRLLVGGNDGVARIFDASGTTLLATLGDPGPAIGSVAWSADGSVVAVAAGSWVTLWRVALPPVDAGSLRLEDAPFALEDGAPVARFGRGIAQGATNRARMHHRLAIDRMVALDHDGAARHCELAYHLETWSGYLACAGMSHGAAGNRAAAVALLRDHLAPIQKLSSGTSQDEATEAMRDHFNRGQDLYMQRLYHEAIAEFETAFEIKPAASLHYNIAVCHEKLRDFDSAAKMFRRYLDEWPDVRDREAVSMRIAALETEASRP